MSLIFISFLQNRHRLEALRMRDQEEAFLRKQMNPRKAKEIAEQKYRVRILLLSSFLHLGIAVNLLSDFSYLSIK